MSNLKNNRNIASQKSSENSLKKERWNTIQNDLSNALDTWVELDKKEERLSPEEEQFKQIKSIISRLREKLEQF